MTLAPNPTADGVVIQLEGSATLTIRDAQGKLLSRRQISSGESISLKNYADGVYLFELDSEKAAVVKRVVKQ